MNSKLYTPRKIQDKKRYILAFIIGTAIFLFGFFITYSVSYFQYQRISNFQDETSYQIFKDKLRYSLFNQDLCNTDSMNQISGALRFQGAIIDDLEKRLGKNNKEVLFRKRFYTLVELEHFDFINKLNQECNKEISTLLFFYSNKKSDIGNSEDAGRMLDTTYLRNKNLMIYSFDINLESDLIADLREEYSIQESPTIIINGVTKIVNPQYISEIEDHLERIDEDVIIL